MPKLEILRLGNSPYDGIPIGVTAKGFVALADHCLDLSTLCIHFQVASLSAPTAIDGMISNVESANLRRDCPLASLDVGEISISEESVSVVAVTLARIFPRLESINYIDENQEKVTNTISLSREIVD